MKQIDYILKVKNAGDVDSTAWEEPMCEIVEDDVTIEQHAKDIVDNFNATLRPHEKAREFISAISTVKKENAVFPHDWRKVSLVTEKGGFDKMKCSRCGATGKRYGLGSYVQIDKKFKKYIDGCPNK